MTDKPSEIDKLAAEAIKQRKELSDAARDAADVITEACQMAIASIENLKAQATESRNLNGSYQWNRSDRNGSDLAKRIGKLEVGQAKREEQILGLMHDVATIASDLDHLKTTCEDTSKEMTSRLTTARELVLEVRDGLTKDIAAFKSRNLWQLVLILTTAFMTMIFIVVNYYIRI